MSSKDIEYHRKRAIEETAMASAATDEAAAKAHAELALYHQASVNRAEGFAPVVVPIGRGTDAGTRPTLGVEWNAPSGDQ